MNDDIKTKEQLIREVAELRAQTHDFNSMKAEIEWATAALRESEERFRNLMNYIPGVAIQGYDVDGKVFYWNKASEQVYGFTTAEAIGRNLGDMTITPEVMPLFKKALEVGRTVTKSGEFLPPGELVLKRKDGSPVWVYSIHTAVNIDGKQPLFFCIDVDLSESKRVEKELQHKIDELEKFKKLAVSRSLEIIELKKEITKLQKK